MGQETDQDGEPGFILPSRIMLVNLLSPQEPPFPHPENGGNDVVLVFSDWVFKQQKFIVLNFPRLEV